MTLGRVRWSDAIEALEERYGAEPSPAQAALLADASSLSALFEDDYAVARRRAARAAALEPLSPLHRARAALLRMRFGDCEGALEGLQELAQTIGPHPIVAYLRGLSTLRLGDAKRAGTIAGDLLTGHPGFAPAQFLQAEAHLRVQVKGLERRLHPLPASPEHAAAWADLLIKLLLIRPAEGAKLARSYLERGVPPKGSREASLVQEVLAWSAASPEEIARALLDIAPGSRREQMALLFFDERLAATEKDASRLRALRDLYKRLPARRAVRRLYAAALAERAVEEARRERYGAALGAVEACLRLEPHETIHYQNRAALFTLMVEGDAYHDGWAELDRHHYRLALLGGLDPEASRRLSRPHRMFARQARITPGGPGAARVHRGVFREERRGGGATEAPVLLVNQEWLDADPEQLRQWIHHRRAELTFMHLSLGPAVERMLLFPRDMASARARTEGLELVAQSLATLVHPEGSRLAEFVGERVRAAAAGVLPRYAPPPEDREARALSLGHLETLGDLAILCSGYSPPARRPELTEELIEFMEAEAPFLDTALLFEVLGAHEGQPSFSLRFLAQRVTTLLALPHEAPALDGKRQREVVQALSASLLLRLALATFSEHEGSREDAADRALPFVDRARRAAPERAEVEFVAARLLIVGSYHDEARAALARFHRLSRGDEGELRAEAEELQRALDARRKDGGAGRKRAGGASAETGGGTVDSRTARAEELEAELSRFPSSIQLHEDLARAVARSGRFDEAIQWAERAMARCLSREGQLRSRTLHLEMLALKELWQTHSGAVGVYLAGTPSALAAAADALPHTDDRPYPVEYLLGRSLLAAKRHEEAERAFARALERCSRQVHLAVLRPLAADIQHALLDQACGFIDDALADGRIGDAFQEIADTWARLSNPAPCLVDLARVQLAAAASALGSKQEPAAPPALETEQPWQERLGRALAEPSALARARALAALALEVHEPREKEAAALLRKIDALLEHVRLVEVIGEATRLLREGSAEAALGALDATQATAGADPRWLRLRAVVLLRLERFAEADAAVAALAGSRDPGARELCEQYPEMRFRVCMGAVNRALRARDTDAAERLLSGARAEGPEQELELAYCAAYRLALIAYRALDRGDRDEAQRALLQAIDALDPHVAVARERGHSRLLTLSAKLDQELNDLEVTV